MDGILLLRQESCIWDMKLKIYWVSKSIAAAKPQNFGHFRGAKTYMGKILGI